MTDDLTRRFLAWRDHGDVDALGAVFDAAAAPLYRIALHLAGDPAEAEDLVQQTFVVAMEKARRFRDDAPLRPWLAGILAHRAKSLLRAKARRPPPDRRVERGPELAAFDAEARQFLREALATLDTPYREVVAAWLDGGKPPREIALELGRAPSRVRLQLHRGIKLLRGRLPRGLALPMVAALAAEPRGLAAVKHAVLAQSVVITAPASGAALLVGGLVMKKLVGIAALLALAAISVWMTAGSREPDEATPLAVGAGPDVVTPSSVPLRPAAPPMSREVAAIRTAPDPLLPLTPRARPEANDAVAGRVVAEGTGAPIAGATVIVRASFGAPPAWSWTGHTDSAGRFRLDAMDLRSSHEIVVHADGFAPHRSSIDQQITEAELVDRAFDLGDLPLNAGEVLEGRVLDASGRPAPGAALFVDDLDGAAGTFHGAGMRAVGTAGGDGGFRIDHVASSSRVHEVRLMAATEDGVAITAVRLLAGVGTVSDVELRIAPSARVTVRVTDTEGHPVRGARVVAEPRFEPLVTVTLDATARGTWQGPEPVHGMWLGDQPALCRWFEARTDARGVATFPALPLPQDPNRDGEVQSPRGPYDFVVTAAGFESGFSDGQSFAPGVDVELDIELNVERSLRLDGLVVDANDRPVDGATISLQTARRDGSNRGASTELKAPTITSDPDGRFSFERVPSGRDYAISASARGFSSVDQPVGPFEDDRAEVTLRLTPSFTIEGRVVDQDHQPVRFVYLQVAPDGPITRTDVDGRFTLFTPFDGEQELVGKLHFPPGRWKDPDRRFKAHSGDRNLELVFERADAGVCALTVDVVDAVDGAPLALDHARLAPDPRSDSRRAAIARVALGRIEVDAVPAGAWILMLQVTGRGVIEERVEIPDEATHHHLHVAVPAFGVVVARVEVADAPRTVRVNATPRVHLEDRGEQVSFVVDAGRPFTLRKLPGPLKLRVAEPFAYGEAEVEVVAGETREVVIQAGTGGRLRTADLQDQPAGRFALLVADGARWRVASDFQRQAGDPLSLVAVVPPGHGRYQVRRAEPGATAPPQSWGLLAEGSYDVRAGEEALLPIESDP